MSTPINNIKNWSDMQLMEDENNNHNVSVTKYTKFQRQVRACKEKMGWRACEKGEQRVCGRIECCQAEEQWRVEAERCRAEEQAKR